MSRQELDLAVDWAAAEGWNPGLHDANCFYAIDPNGFLIGLLETNRLPCCGLINTLASSGRERFRPFVWQESEPGMLKARYFSD